MFQSLVCWMGVVKLFKFLMKFGVCCHVSILGLLDGCCKDEQADQASERTLVSILGLLDGCCKALQMRLHRIWCRMFQSLVCWMGVVKPVPLYTGMAQREFQSLVCWMGVVKPPSYPPNAAYIPGFNPWFVGWVL